MKAQRGRQVAPYSARDKSEHLKTRCCLPASLVRGSCKSVCHAQGLVFNEMRAKTKVIQEPLGMNPKDYPDWSFDGSSTGQAEGNNSDCILKCGVITVLIKHKLCCGIVPHDSVLPLPYTKCVCLRL